jgi:hypothetical protein
MRSTRLGPAAARATKPMFSSISSSPLKNVLYGGSVSFVLSPRYGDSPLIGVYGNQGVGVKYF